MKKEDINKKIKKHEGEIENLGTQLDNMANELFVTIKDFGASEDKEDNVIYINNAIAYVSEKGGGTVKINDNCTFLVNPSTRIYMKNNVKLIGKGCLKVIDNAGNWWTIIDTQDTKNFEISEIKFDVNILNNLTCDISMTGLRPCNVIYGGNNSNVLIKNNTIINCGSVSTIMFDGYGTNENVTIENNDITWVRGRTSEANGWYDNTVIRVGGTKNVKVINNKIKSDINSKAECGIDVETASSSVYGNYVKNFVNFMDIVACNDNLQCLGINVYDNIGENVAVAIQLWQNNLYNVENVNIHDNRFIIDSKSFKTNGMGVYNTEGFTKPIKNLNISDNTFIFLNDDRTDVSSYAFGGVFLTGNCSYDTVTIANNTIKNSPSFSIVVGCNKDNLSFTNVVIRDNKLIDSSRSFASTIILFKQGLSSVNVFNNLFEETILKSNSLSDTQGDLSKNVYIYDNFTNITNGKLGHFPVPFFLGGKMYKQRNKIINGVNGISQGLTGDIVIKSDGVYKVSAQYGTFGTLNGVTGSVESGSKLVTVSDVANINVWDRLVVDNKIISYVTKIIGNVVYLNDACPSTVSNGTVQFVAPDIVKLTT